MSTVVSEQVYGGFNKVSRAEVLVGGLEAEVSRLKSRNAELAFELEKTLRVLAHLKDEEIRRKDVLYVYTQLADAAQAVVDEVSGKTGVADPFPQLSSALARVRV